MPARLPLIWLHPLLQCGMVVTPLLLPHAETCDHPSALQFEDYLANSHNTLLKDLNATLQALRPATYSGPGGTTLLRDVSRAPGHARQLHYCCDLSSFGMTTGCADCAHQGHRATADSSTRARVAP